MSLSGEREINDLARRLVTPKGTEGSLVSAISVSDTHWEPSLSKEAAADFTRCSTTMISMTSN